MTGWVAAFEALPHGAFRAIWQGRSWEVVKSRHAGGKAWKILAREGGGRGRISANVYRLSGGEVLLRPCEMPADRVRRFVLEARAAGTDPDGSKKSSYGQAAV